METRSDGVRKAKEAESGKRCEKQQDFLHVYQQQKED